MTRSSLRDQIAVITGASSGIGRETALALASAGAHVALAARREAVLHEVAAEVRARGSEALVVPTDVTRRADVDRLVARTMARWGQVDVLVANAGCYVRSAIPELTVEAMQRSMGVNFYGALYAVLAVQPHMLARGSGQIVLVSSFDAKKGLPLDAPYVAAKSALSGYGEVLRQELRPYGISVTTVFPGRVDTPLIQSLDVPWISPKIPASRVARAIVSALRHNLPEVIIPFQARLLGLVDGISPRLGDWVVRVFGLEGEERQNGPA